MTYTYPTDGDHCAKVTVRNDASRVDRIVTAGVYKQFSNLGVTLTYPDKSSGVGLVVDKEGLLNQGRMFPLDEPIKFTVSDANNAFATRYYVNSTGASPETINDVYYTNSFERNFSAVGDYTLEITAFNPLYSNTITKQIQLVKRVKSMSIKEEKPVVAPGQLKSFYITLASYGPDACVYIDWNTGINFTKFGDNVALCNDPNYDKAALGGNMQKLTSQLVGMRYLREGLYTMKATASSLYGSDYQEVTFAISRVRCTKPEVDIDSKNTKFNESSSYTRSSIIRVRGLANIDCPASLTNRKSWTLEEAETVNGTVIGPANTAGLVTDKAELYIPARTLVVGLYKATYSMVMIDGTETIFNNSAFTYFKVIESDLIGIMIEGGMTEVTRGSQQTILLEPLKWSFDPDLETGTSQGLTVTEWKCLIIPTNTPQTTCNNVIGTGPTQTILGSNLLINTTYNITAKLVKGSRSVVTSLQILMAGTNPPLATIRCIQGSVCLPRTGGFTILETSRVSLECSCPSCSATALYQWTVFIDDYRWNRGWRPLQEADVQERSISLSSKELSLEKELFARYANKTDVFRAACSIKDGGGNGNAATNLYINKPPRGGYCSINPVNATATPKADKQWILTCEEWQDSDGIKEFQFFSVFDDEEVEYEITSYPTYGQMYASLTINVSLPIGPTYNSYKQQVKVVVRDIYSAATEKVVLDVIVRPPNKDQVRSYISQVLSNPNSNFYKVFQEGDQRSVSELAAAIASSLNQDARDSRDEYSKYEVPSNMICTGYGPYDSVRPNAYKEVSPDRDEGGQYDFDNERNQRSELRTQMVKLALNLSYQDAVSIQQVAGLLAQASAEPTEITTECQNLIINGLNNMIDTLNDRKKMVNTPQEDIEKAMTLIFSALGAVMEAAGANGNFPTISEMKETQKKPEWKVYDTSIKSLGDETDMESARSDDEAMKMHTRYIHKTLFKDKARAFADQSNAVLKKMVILFSSFAIPGQVQNATSFRMKYRMEKNFVEKFIGMTIKLDRSDVQVVLPDTLQQLFPNQNVKKDDVLTFQVAQTTNYPDRYSALAESSIFTYTHFVTLNFFDKTGAALQVNQTLQPIKVTIPHDANGPRGVKKVINPLVTQWNQFQLHQTETKSSGASIHLNFELAAGTQLLVVARYDGIPNPAENETDFIFVVPPTIPPDPKLKDPYTIVVSNIDLSNRKGKWWFGTRERFDDDINTPAPTNAEISEKYEKGAGPFKNMYNITLWTSGCFFLTDGADDWDDAGCEVSVNSTADKTVCSCNHMTTFAGGFVVVPNVIDWNYVFSNADFLSNPTLYLTEIFIAVVFSVAFFLARRKDKKDVTLLGLAPLADNDPRDKYYYEIIVSTGMRRNAGTDSKVYFIMSGEDEESDVRLFSDSKRPIFKRGMTNGFLMATPECLGRINYMRVWHDNSGKGKFGSWFLNYIIVKDLQTDTKQVFIANRWFALEEDDGQIDRIIPLAGKEQMEDFSYQFAERSKKNLADGHLWFSVIARPPGSRFTCVERVACCLCLLFMTMLTNAMFYNTDSNTSTSSSTSFTFGPFSLSVSQIFIGFISTVIVFPVNFLLVFLFRKAQPRQKRPSRVRLAFTNERPGTAKLSQVKPQMDNGHSRSTTSLATTASYPDGRSDNERLVVGSSREGSSPSPSEAEAMMLTGKKKKSCQLPWWCKWVAWALLLLCTLMSASLVTFYGISFKDETCKKWITSLIISFFTSVFITQPVKVILTAIFLSLVIKNPGEEEDDEENDEETYPINKDDSFLHTEIQGSFAAARPKKVGYKPPNPKELAKLREIRLNEVKMWAVIREILFYSMFLWVLLIISHRNRGPDNFNYKNNMVRTFITNQNLDPDLVEFQDIKSTADFWQWLQHGFMNGIMANAYYNDYPPLRLRTYINDKSSRILGHATLRQLRIKPDKCTVPDIMETVIKECNVEYTIADQEERDFSEGWGKFNATEQDTSLKTEYMWSTEDSLNSYPYWGIISIYSGGGYVAHLNGTRDEVNDTLYRLQDENWIDKYTRAVFIEFTVYNPQVNLFSVNMILAEFNIASGIIPSYRFEPAMLLPYMDGAMIFQIVCEVLFVAYIIGFIVIEFLQFLKQRSTYFFQFWNWVEISIISISITAIIIYFYRLHEANKLTKQFKASNGNEYIKFQYVGYWNEIFAYLIGFIVFLATIKYLRLLRFNRRISMLADTLKHSGKHLFHFSIIFWIIFFAFCQLFFLTFRFGDDNHASIDRSAISLILMLMGKFSIYSMSMVDPVLSQIYILVYVIGLSFIILNMFVSILTDTFSAVREDLQKQNNDYEIVDFMLGRLKKWTGVGVPPSTTIDPNANKSLGGYANDGYVNDDENSDLNDENEDKDKDRLNPNMAMFPSRIDKLLHSLSAIYRENDNSAMAAMPWGKQPYQAPPRATRMERPDSNLQKRRSSLAKVDTA
ncbi:unnamed protein product [Lymnaea stagnalis]|uniref:PLAT domain-containing protein n=1 Tax=Lymnaea stagnalis TaxID=6523 RepID=A0AAV2IBR1_LYMST